MGYWNINCVGFVPPTILTRCVDVIGTFLPLGYSTLLLLFVRINIDFVDLSKLKRVSNKNTQTEDYTNIIKN